MTGVPKQNPLKTYREKSHVKMEAETVTLATGEWMTRTAGNHQKLEEKHGTDSPSEAPEGTNLANTFDFELLAS